MQTWKQEKHEPRLQVSQTPPSSAGARIRAKPLSSMRSAQLDLSDVSPVRPKVMRLESRAAAFGSEGYGSDEALPVTGCRTTGCPASKTAKCGTSTVVEPPLSSHGPRRTPYPGEMSASSVGTTRMSSTRW